jgi:hypothetical protein
MCAKEDIGTWDDFGIRWRTYLSVGLGTAWLVGFLLWWRYLADGYDDWQVLAVGYVSLIAVAAVVSVPWLSWVVRYDPNVRDRRGLFIGYVAATFVVFLGMSSAAVYYLWWMAADQGSTCASLGVLLVLLIAMAAIVTPMWMRWGREVTRMKAGAGDGPEEDQGGGAL